MPEWTQEALAAAVTATAESFEIKMGKLGQSIRIAVTAGSVSMPIDLTLYLVGRKRAMKRLAHAIEYYEKRARSAPQ